MKIEIKSFWGSVLFSNDAETLRDAVIAAVKSSANLSGADLHSANLRYANLSGADLHSADLSYANLYGANLSGANLSGANLRSADLRGANLLSANLSYANLSGANLSGADLHSADLHSANLSGADLHSADLSGADLINTKLPSPTAILFACWGEVSDELCADLMEYDAWVHGDRKAFETWVSTGVCPYADDVFQRAAVFTEKKSVFGKGSLKSPIELLKRLFAEKQIKR